MYAARWQSPRSRETPRFDTGRCPLEIGDDPEGTHDATRRLVDIRVVNP
jgi:hypothetical protein